MIALGQLLLLGWRAGTGSISFPWFGEATVCGTVTAMKWETWPGIGGRNPFGAAGLVWKGGGACATIATDGNE